ncbi:MAG: hypothetical protein RMM17_08900 [Acidobacteriota bacterium]|nr:hypothetical protein [Blastocatellia bacterium]MDW8412784.1 hypothetical protein [Acidobacteriota bacterium]
MRPYFFLLTLVLSTEVFAQKDYQLTVTPSQQTVNAGRSATYTVTAVPSGGFKKSVSLSLQLSPPSSDVTATLASSVLAQGSSTTLTVNTSASASAQTVQMVVVGVAGKRTRSVLASISINVPQFSLSITPPTLSVVQGERVRFTISTQGEPDFNRDVVISANTQPTVGFTLSKTTLRPPTDSATLEVGTEGLPVGTYIVNIAATAGNIARQASASFTVTPRPPAAGTARLRVNEETINIRADEEGHVLVTGQVENFGDGDAIFVEVTIKVFKQGNRLVETRSTFINGFPAITSSGVFIRTALPRGKKASFQRVFDVAYLFESQTVEITINFLQDNGLRAPQANLVVLSLQRTVNQFGGSNYSVRVRNNGTVTARAPQVIIDGFNRADQLFNVVIAGKGELSDTLAPGAERTFTAFDKLDFNQTRINESHCIWIDDGARTFADEPDFGSLTGLALQEKLYQYNLLQKLTHQFILKYLK